MPTLVPKGFKNWWQKTFTRRRKRTIKQAENAKKTAYRISRNARGTVKNIKPISKSLAKVLPPSSVAYTLAREKPTLYQRLLGKAKGLNKPPTSAPLQEPLTSYPMFKGNTRRNQESDEVVKQVLISRQKPKLFENTSIPIEEHEDGTRRIRRFLLEKYRKTIGPTTGVYRNHATNAELYELFLLVQKYIKQNGLDHARMAEDLFHTPLDRLNEEIDLADGVRNNARALIKNRQGKAVYAESYGKYLERMITGILEIPRQISYAGDWAKYLCGLQQSEINTPIAPDLDTSPYCICCFVNKSHFIHSQLAH